MAGNSLGSVLRRRRRQLDITQQDIAERVGVRANYIGYLERDLRRPSTEVLLRVAKVLDLDKEELFFLANPQVRTLIAKNGRKQGTSAWDLFRNDKRLHTRYAITREEVRTLGAISHLGQVATPRDYLFILQAIRQALVGG